jgi:hypothetical protein
MSLPRTELLTLFLAISFTAAAQDIEFRLTVVSPLTVIDSALVAIHGSQITGVTSDAFSPKQSLSMA